MAISRTDVVLGIGDDAALLAAAAGSECVATVTVLIPHPGEGGNRFAERLVECACAQFGDGSATPAWATLGLALDDADDGWLEHFAVGLAGALSRLGVQLVGGDTTRGRAFAVMGLHGTRTPAAAPVAGLP